MTPPRLRSQPGGKALIYTGDFRGHGRKSDRLELFVRKAAKDADALLIEGTTLGRNTEEVLTEQDIEDRFVKKVSDFSRTGAIPAIQPEY